MRLSEVERRAIVTIAREVIGGDVQVRLFGSRADDRARGGDIDLYITDISLAPALQGDAKLQFLVKLKRQLGDQRIDLILAPPAGQTPLPIHQMAQQTGILL